MKEILDVIHKTIYRFFDVYNDEETPISEKDKLLLEVNKAITNAIKELEDRPNCGADMRIKDELNDELSTS